MAVTAAAAVALMLEEMWLLLKMVTLEALVLLLIRELELALKMVMVPTVALMREIEPTARRKVAFRVPTQCPMPRTAPIMVGLKAPCMRDITGLKFNPSN